MFVLKLSGIQNIFVTHECRSTPSGYNDLSEKQNNILKKDMFFSQRNYNLHNLQFYDVFMHFFIMNILYLKSKEILIFDKNTYSP